MSNTTVVLLVRSEEDARELLEELADDARVVAAHVELGDGKYVLANITPAQEEK